MFHLQKWDYEHFYQQRHQALSSARARANLQADKVVKKA